MRDKKFYFLICVLLIATGYLIGSGYKFINISISTEVKISDIIALAVGSITFYFAYQGLSHSRFQSEIVSRPYLDCIVDVHFTNHTYELKIHNLGSGPAINCKFALFLDNKPITFDQLSIELAKTVSFYKNIDNSKKLPESIGPNNESNFFSFKVNEPNTTYFKPLLELMKKVTVTVKYESVLQKEFSAKFHFLDTKNFNT
ncbi:hypothetical protein [Pseudoalteromonas sp. T1lg21]|uniref:hypothetical protein n=1 Tax=Pseudoalteromonas sp. T1lg21 TaxID=2077095 RepID=UPI000CF6ACFE|nr:hypothetical protein [Pseudoalteromonas sp. T1lg21]